MRQSLHGWILLFGEKEEPNKKKSGVRKVIFGFREIQWMVWSIETFSTKSPWSFCANRLVEIYILIHTNRFNYKIASNPCVSSTHWRFLIVSCIGEIFIFYSSLFLSFAEGFITVELNWLDWFLMILLSLYSISVLSPFLDYEFLMVGINDCSSESSERICGIVVWKE